MKGHYTSLCVKHYRTRKTWWDIFHNFISSVKGNLNLIVNDVFVNADDKIIKVLRNKQHPRIYKPRSENLILFCIT